MRRRSAVIERIECSELAFTSGTPCGISSGLTDPTLFALPDGASKIVATGSKKRPLAAHFPANARVTPKERWYLESGDLLLLHAFFNISLDRRPRRKRRRARRRAVQQVHLRAVLECEHCD